MTATVQHSVAFAEDDGDAVAGGNPCPVVLGAEDWTGEQMRAAAEGFGHETCFVLAPREGGHVRLRYFVPAHEMEMCVHATVAATHVLGRAGRVPADVVRVETPLGVRRVWRDGDDALFEQFPPRLEEPLAHAGPVVAALGADPGDLAPAVGPVQSVSTARAKLMVPLAGEAALDALTPDFPALWDLCDRLEVTGVYAFTRAARGAGVAARQFPVRAGYDEDPATGVAAAALAAYLAVHEDAHADGWRRVAVAQGRAMGRPSRMEAAALREGDRIAATRVGGRAAVVGAPQPLAVPTF